MITRTHVGTYGIILYRHHNISARNQKTNNCFRILSGRLKSLYLNIILLLLVIAALKFHKIPFDFG